MLIIGTAAGIRKYRAWVKSITNFIPAKKPDQHHLAFPGFEAAFRTKWPEKPIVELEISATALSNAVRVAEPHKRVFGAVDLFDEAIRNYLRQEDVAPAVWFVVIPEDVHRFCRPQSTVPRVERIEDPI